MSILGRLIIRNIFGKPLRSLAIITALAASAFALLFSIGGRDAPAVELRNMMLRSYGGSEIMMLDKSHSLHPDISGFPEGTVICLQNTASGRMKTNKGEYTVSVRCMDMNAAYDIGLTETVLDPKDGVLVSKAFSEKCGVGEGDTVTVTCADRQPAEVKITAVTDDRSLRGNSSRLLIGAQLFESVSGQSSTGYSAALVDIPDELDVEKTAASLMSTFEGKNYIITPLLTDELLEEINSQTMAFFLIFAVILLMTLFLTFSMSRHIANERLSIIGTLRSLGGSISKTSRILIIESAVYGLIGGAVGILGYLLAGDLAVGAFFSESTVREYSMPLWSYPLAMVLTVVVQVAAQSGALIRAVKTPVRDIIFSSRDTAYHFSRVKTVTGFIILAAGIAAGMLASDMIVSVAAITLLSIGSVMILPLIIKGISKLLVKLFRAAGMPCAKLAAVELSYKKSTVAATQLTFIALSITTAIFITVQSITGIFNADVYNFDARIDASAEEDKLAFIRELPEITDAQFLLNTFCSAGINGGKKQNIAIAGYDDYRLFTSIKELGDEPAENECYISTVIAGKYSLEAGDSFELTDYNTFDYKPDGSREYSVYKLTVKGICNTRDHYSETLVVNKKFYNDNFGKYITYIYVSLKNKDDIAAVREKLEAKDPEYTIISVEELIAEDKENTAGMMTILYSITAIGCILALLGAVSNAAIGFEQSRRKYAMLHSTAASKRRIAKIIMLETLLSAVTSGVLAMLMGVLLSGMIGTAMSELNLGIDVSYNIPMTASFVLVLIAMLMLAAIRPILALRRMDTAAELKYE